MARSSLLRVMISSRCLTMFDGKKLSDIRGELKREIEALTIFDNPLFEVWINEEAHPKYGGWDSVEVCLEAVRDCDILIVLSNGHAGWSSDVGGIGICHAEMMEGINTAPGKVRLIDLGNVPANNRSQTGRRNKLFQDYIETQGLFHGGTVETVAELKQRVKDAVFDALVSLTQAGVLDASRGRYHSGSALDWSHLDFEDRRDQMRRVLRDTIFARSVKGSTRDELVVELGGEKVLCIPHAIPAALSIGPAKEMVGQPFLYDHESNDMLVKHKCGGPLHIIACQKTASELQALKILGFPDATVVSAPFGVFVADNIQKVQFAFIVNCRDETTTRYGTQRFFTWLAQSQEERFVSKRARARAAIVQTIAENIKMGSVAAPVSVRQTTHGRVLELGFSRS